MLKYVSKIVREIRRMWFEVQKSLPIFNNYILDDL